MAEVKADSVYELRVEVRGPILGNKQFKRLMEYCFRHRTSGAQFARNAVTATFYGVKAGGNLKQFLRRNFAMRLSHKKGLVETNEVMVSVERKRDVAVAG